MFGRVWFLLIIFLDAVCGSINGQKNIAFIPSVPSFQKNKTNSETTDKKLQFLIEAAEAYEQKISDGSAEALNHIASAFYTLGEKFEKEAKNKKQKDLLERAKIFFEKAEKYFHLSSKVDSKEALYNRGLALTKLEKYDEAATCYRNCINSCTEKKCKNLVMKSANNLAILILEKKVPQDIEEVQNLMILGKDNTGKIAENLVQTAVIILTEMNTETTKEKEHLTEDSKATPELVFTSNVKN